MFKKLSSALMFILFCAKISENSCAQHDGRKMQAKVIDLVHHWVQAIGQKLDTLSNTLTEPDKIRDSLHDDIEEVNGMDVLEKFARNMREFMDNKTAAVRNIAEYAEFLSYYRRDDELFANSPYYYYNSDNVTDSDNETLRLEVLKDVFMAECSWFCDQRNILKPQDNFRCPVRNITRPFLKKNAYTEARINAFFNERSKEDEKIDCDCCNLMGGYRPKEHFWSLPFDYDPRFGEKVNLNLSIIKTPINVYDREQNVLEGIRWSEALDWVFKDNFDKDPSLTWQYFASPYGYMRHFPAVEWSDEDYDQTYDFRTRSWYTEAMTSPKDVMILMDNSGSMMGTHRALCTHIVNDILDTLNDNDFVNIYLFNNSTEPLVSCFNNSLMQANEENLRLLRESLPHYEDKFVSDITIGLEKAFEILRNFRIFRSNSTCNQAIMLITAGVDYYIDSNLFKRYNWFKNNSVRIFTYQIGSDCTDARQLEWIACSNMGYYVNMTVMSDVREKILQYMNVLSRPINYNYQFKHQPTGIWSYLYVDLADRRLSNWLWKKYEGNRQREVFLDHLKRKYMESDAVFTSSRHYLLQEDHKYKKYQKPIDYNYMTTVSLPVYARRDEEIELLGVAGVDVPLKLLRNFIPYHRLGVNGYAFICTNNGYVLMHPDHRPEFENILKPTFNRVDFLEVEILDDASEPRLFNQTIVELREQVVQGRKVHAFHNVKFALNEMKRIIKSGREYFLAPLGPFTLGIVLPHRYGRYKVSEKASRNFIQAHGLFNTKNWKVHPDWIYCTSAEGKTAEEKLRNSFRVSIEKRGITPLYSSLLYDANRTIWFENDPISKQKISLIKNYLVNKLFLSTHSGLTRWRNVNLTFVQEDDKDSFEKRNSRSIDEDWYRRSVEENYKDEDKFIYSVPFEISGYENNTMITGTKAIFLTKEKKKSPVAVVGLQFNHRAMYELYHNITLDNHEKTVKCGTNKFCNITCQSDYLDCFILDNNAYIVLSDEIEYTGRFIGDIRADIMHHLIKDGVFEATRMFDYQAICQYPKDPKKKRGSTSSSSPRFSKMFKQFSQIFNWALSTIFFWIKMVMAGPDYQSNKKETIEIEKLEIKKTYPTPCDHEFYLFTVGTNFKNSIYHANATKFDCDWPYVVEKIPKSNLLFMAINGHCKFGTETYTNSTEPKELKYTPEILPCYIATKNNYTRRGYMQCFNRDEREKNLNEKNSFYCGHTWEPKGAGCNY